MTKRNVIFNIMLGALITLGADAAVVSRTTASRVPTMSANINKKTSVSSNTIASSTNTTATTPTATKNTSAATPIYIYEYASKDETTPVEYGPVENKSAQFDTVLDVASSSKTDAAASSLAAMVRAQRAALDAASNVAPTTSASRVNTCDSALRSCMTDKCGKNFTKCTSDTDTTFGTKLDSCRRGTTCTANEFKLLSAEIKADRTQSIKLKTFNDILECGNEYDACIVNQCGTTYSKCLGKSDGDAAISKCASVATRCAAMDSGMPGRAMGVFATLRQSAEAQVLIDETKLYAMRDDMRSICKRIGAMFDDRSLDCVYTVNFYAGDDSTQYASKKLYAGGTFDCTPNWFGIDVTTFMDNAYRRTRAQTSATSSVLGSGVGMAVGSLTSGAIDRAIDTKKAETAVSRAECEQERGGTWNAFLGTCVEDKSVEKAQKQQDRQQKRAEKDPVTISGVVNKVAGGVSNAVNTVKTGVANAATAVGTGVSNAAGAVADVFTPDQATKDKRQAEKEKKQKQDQKIKQQAVDAQPDFSTGNEKHDEKYVDQTREITTTPSDTYPKPETWTSIYDANTQYRVMHSKQSATTNFVDDTRKFIRKKYCNEQNGGGYCFNNKLIQCRNNNYKKTPESDPDYDVEYAVVCGEQYTCDTYIDLFQKTAYNCHVETQPASTGSVNPYICDGTDMESMIRSAGSLDDIKTKSYDCWKRAAMLWVNDKYCDTHGTTNSIRCYPTSSEIVCQQNGTEFSRYDLKVYDNGMTINDICNDSDIRVPDVPDSNGYFTTDRTNYISMDEEEPPATPGNTIYDVVGKNRTNWLKAAKQYLQDKYCVTPNNYDFTCSGNTGDDVKCKNGQYKSEYTPERRRSDVSIACQMKNQWSTYAVRVDNNNYSAPRK